MTERDQALDVLIAVLERGEYLPDAAATAYIKKVTKGVVERAIELDFRLNAVASKKVKRMHPIVRNILRLGAYELLYMDSIPGAASVNECVKLAKRRKQAQASGMVNAVLRKLAALAEVEVGADSDAALSVRYSMPEWIVRKWIDRFGTEQTEEMLQAFLQEKPLTVRVNQSRISMEELQEMFARAGVRSERVEGISAALALRRDKSETTEQIMESQKEKRTEIPKPKTEYLHHAPVTELPGFTEGFFYIQDSSSMQVCTMADIRRGESVLDVCAAPGGKALHAADLVGASGTVEARDISERKIRKIEENVRRCRFSNITAKAWDAAELDEDCVGKYDAVLADVPCSGLGVLGRKPEIKYRLTEEDIRGLAEIQKEILECVQAYVKPNGRLVYSTCTISDLENEKQTAEFLKRHTEFEKIAEKQILPRTDYPGDGFYICVMKRKS